VRVRPGIVEKNDWQGSGMTKAGVSGDEQSQTREREWEEM
jgi:hypothetical protein